MTKTLKKLAAAAMAVAFMASAQAVSVQLGTVVPGSPANLAEELKYVNTLVDLANGLTLAQSANDVAGYTYNLTTNPSETLAYATGTGALDVEDWTSAITITGYTYVVAKYGNEAVIYYSSDASGISLAANIQGKGGLSHYTALNPGRTNVPDGGATVALLGVGLLGLGAMRRKLS